VEIRWSFGRETRPGVTARAPECRLGGPTETLSAGMATDQDRMRRFTREAKAASELKHPNVATIYDIGKHDGTSFIAMEYIEGHTLAATISGRPLGVGEIVEITIQVADALGEAQSKGVTHRDIKPSNIMLTPRGQVKVLDFGLAKITRPEWQAVSSDISTVSGAETGVVMGTAPLVTPAFRLQRSMSTQLTMENAAH
jgi:serine/threonine protein kinase